MRQLIKKFLCVGFLASSLQLSWGFALQGPLANGGDNWQLPAIGYGYAYTSYGLPGGPVFLGDIGGPKNISEEYRRNVPVLYYTYNANFLGFFGSNGVAAADSAFDIMNSLNSVDSYSTDLSEFPLQAMHPNYLAQSLYLTDVKSVTLHLLVEQLGLSQPERFTWTLHDRVAGNKCPLTTTYLLTMRNFDIIDSPLNQVQYSPYVNNVLYSYYIEEFCAGSPTAITVPFSVDPLAEQYTSVAANNFDINGFGFGGGLQIGNFYTGLTRDDMAGLRYLMTTNNINRENSASGSQALIITTNFLSQIPFPTNSAAPGGYGTYDLSALTSSARTNDPATLQTLFPGVIVATSSNYLTIVATPIVSAKLKNLDGAPIGSPPKLVFVTNGFTYSPQTIYVTTFANVVTNHYRINPTATLLTVSTASYTGAPWGSPLVGSTNYQTVTLTNTTAGDYYTLSPDLCPMNLVSVLYSNVVMTTNVLSTANTNLVTTSNTTVFASSQYLVTAVTNYVYLANPVNCSFSASNAPALYQGIQNVKFVRANFDSLIGQFFQPVTNNYSMTVLVNGQLRPRNFQRIVTQPDILFTATDQGAANTFNGTVFRNINYDQGTVLPGLAGPGVINATTTFDFNKIGAAFWNGPFSSTNGFINEVNELSQTPSVAWASFDGTTNAPIVYPNGISLANLANQVLVQVSPASLPVGTSGVAYPAVAFTASGGSFSPPFTWSLVFGSSPLPSGMSLSSSGILSGTPTQSGTFDLIVQLTDSLSRSVQWNFTLTIQ